MDRKAERLYGRVARKHCKSRRRGVDPGSLPRLRIDAPASTREERREAARDTAAEIVGALAVVALAFLAGVVAYALGLFGFGFE